MQFQSQLAELEKLPEILKITETQLAECQDQLQSYEKKNVDLSVMIADLRQRVRDWQKVPAALQSASLRPRWISNHRKVQTSSLFSPLFEKIKRALQNKGVCYVFVQEVSGVASSIPCCLKGFSSLDAEPYWDLNSSSDNTCWCQCLLLVLPSCQLSLLWFSANRAVPTLFSHPEFRLFSQLLFFCPQKDCIGIAGQLQTDMTSTTMPQDTQQVILQSDCFTLIGLELQTFLALMPLWAAVMYVAALNLCALLCLQVAALHTSVGRPSFSFAVRKNFLIPFQTLAGSTGKMNV